MTSLLVLMLAMAAAPTPAEAAPTAKQAPAVPAVDTAPPQAPPVAVPQAVDSDSSSPSPEPAQPASPESELMTARRSDAAIDQAWLSPTALTQPRGSVTLETHDLVLLTSTIGVFDRLQLTFRVVPGFIAGDWLPSGGFKAHVMSTDHFHASVFANATGLGGDFVLTLGAVVTFCTSASCGGAFSVYGSVDPVNHKAISDNPNHWDTAYLYGASAVGALGRRTKLVAELNLVGTKGSATTSRPARVPPAPACWGCASWEVTSPSRSARLSSHVKGFRAIPIRPMVLGSSRR